MIDLGRKDSCCPSPCSPCETAPAPRINYPSMHITSEKAIKLPDGEFEATIKCRCKSGEWREDESGKKICTYTLEVMGIAPGKSAAKEEDDDEGEPDAAAAIMESMKQASNKKLKED